MLLFANSMRTNWTVTRRNYFLVLMTFLAGISCGSAPAPDKTVYSNTSNKELKQKALRLVKNIRELVDSYSKKDRELMSAYDKKNKPEIRIDERKAMREQWRSVPLAEVGPPGRNGPEDLLKPLVGSDTHQCRIAGEPPCPFVTIADCAV